MGKGNGTRRSRALAVGTAFAGLVAAAAVVIPALASSPAPGAVRLHLGTDGQYFAYGDQTQPIAQSGCKITSPAGSLMKLSAANGKSPGLFSNSIGVKGSSSTGTPCGQVDSGESLTIERGSTLSGRRFTGVRLDLEMTGDAVVKLTLEQSSAPYKKVTYQLQTGRSIASSQKAESDYDKTAPYVVSSLGGETVDACAAPNSSGPNSNINDNCQWTVMPGFDFDKATLTTSCGTVSLEGGGDFGTGMGNDTLFYLSNSPPTATDNAYVTDEDQPVSGNVLTDGTPDSDPDGNPLTATKLSNPARGVLTFNGDGSFTYSPQADDSGTYTFTYKVSDGVASSNVATVTLRVDPVNDPPVGIDGTTTGDEDDTVTIPVATDVDDTDLTAECVAEDEEGQEVEGVEIVDNGDGSIDVTPPPNFNGTLSVECTVTDPHGASTTPTAKIVVTVDPISDPPVAEDDEAEVGAGGSVQIDVLANDTDADGDELTVVDLPAQTAGGGALSEAGGVVTYTPAPGFAGLDSFTYRASDGELSDLATVTIDVFTGMCTNEPVALPEGSEEGFVGTFTLLTDYPPCKRYELETSDGTILFVPSGDVHVAFRGIISFGPEDPPGGGGFPSQLRYDPDPADADDSTQPVQWCSAFAFDGDGLVTLGTVLPSGETWCIAAVDVVGGPGGQITATWQVFGEGDPRFTR
jgi:hypothetical protein